MGWNLKIQYILSGGVFLTAIALFITVYKDWFIPSPFTCFVLVMSSLGLYAVHVLQQQLNRVKEISLLFSIGTFINLLISVFVYNIWKWETVFTKQGMSKMFLFVLLLTTIYLIVAYVRAKISYKKVKGNQRDNNKWRVSNRKKEELEKSKEIYLTLGTVYERPDE